MNKLKLRFLLKNLYLEKQRQIKIINKINFAQTILETVNCHMSSSITQTQLEEVRRNAICILENRLYFYATKHRLRPQSAGLKVVNFDREFVYEGFNNDFGPLNIAQITEYCRIMENQLQRLKRTNAKKKQLMGVDPSDSEEELDMRLPDSGVPGRGVILVHHASN